MALDTLKKSRVFLGYLAMLVSTGVIFWLLTAKGRQLQDSSVLTVTGQGEHGQINQLLHILIALTVVIITARVAGALFKLFHQPPIIGEVIGGILLGPSFLGRYAPELAQFLLPPTSLPSLGIIAQIGVIFYMFVVGLELDLGVLRKSGHATLAISHASIIVPFLLGTAFAVHYYEILAPKTISFMTFALFLGVSMSITAFPVLARILTDRKVNKTRLGTIALTCAAVDDVTAWCLLAFIVSMAQAKVGSAVLTIGLTIGYVLLMLMIGGPLIRRLIPMVEKFDELTDGGVAIFFIALLLSALATESIGIHAIFGAFLLGAVTPHDSRVAAELTKRIEDLIKIVFLPIFFAFTGMRTQISLLETASDWQICGIIILVASIGKFGGTFIASWLCGFNWRESSCLGILMNTRGLVELIVLNLGLDMGIITPRLFAMLVVMALFTTFITTPILSLLTWRHPWKE